MRVSHTHRRKVGLKNSSTRPSLFSILSSLLFVCLAPLSLYSLSLSLPLPHIHSLSLSHIHSLSLTFTLSLTLSISTSFPLLSPHLFCNRIVYFPFLKEIAFSISTSHQLSHHTLHDVLSLPYRAFKLRLQYDNSPADKAQLAAQCSARLYPVLRE